MRKVYLSRFIMLSSLIVIIGAFFKIQHWTGANLLMSIGLLLGLILLVFYYKFDNSNWLYFSVNRIWNLSFEVYKMKRANNLIRVFTGTEVSVILLKSRLEEIGISAIIQNDFQSGITAGFLGGIPSAIDLYIQQFDYKKAEPIINEFIQSNKG